MQVVFLLLFLGARCYTANNVVYEDDMLQIEGQALRDPRNRWPRDDQGFIPFYFDDIVDRTAQRQIREAFQFWEDNTCLRFRESRQSVRGTPKIRIYDGSRCSSSVGMIWNSTVQRMSLPSGCEQFGTATHEIAHALGFHHEHSRFDRDAYVSLNRENVAKELRTNFDKYSQLETDNYGVPYDYGSVMQYPGYSWYINPDVKTIIANDRNHQETMGQRIAPSFFDLLLMNKHYGCLDRCKPYNTVCQNQGFPNPRNCYQCICPWGFAGRFCELRDVGRNASAPCGADLQAELSWKSLSGRIVNNGEKLPKHDHCHWHIKAPTGKRIVVHIKNSGNQCIPGCVESNLELKMGQDVRFSGYRMCCPEEGRWNGKEFTSENNLVVVSLYVRTWIEIELLYRYVEMQTFSRSLFCTPTEIVASESESGRSVMTVSQTCQKISKVCSY